MSKTKTILDKMRNILLGETALEEVKTADGSTIFADTFAEGEAVFIVNPETEERIPLPTGSYDLEGGGVLTVEEEGIIASITTGEEPPEEQPEEQPETMTKDDIVEIVKETIKSMQKDEMQSYVDAMQEEINQLKASLSEQVVELTKVIEEYGEQPSAEPVKPNPNGKVKNESVTLQSRHTSLPRSTKSKVFAKLFRDY